jgi:pimeloyl-ACP methyl ester carboxylesterase
MTAARTIEHLRTHHVPKGANSWRGVAALLSAPVGLIVGVGVGLRWLRAGVVTWESVGAIAGLLTGAALTILGLHWVTSGMRPVTRVALAFLVVLATALVVWTFTPAVIATNVPPTDHSPDLGLGGRQVHFTSEDGIRLWGWYVPPHGGGVVVVRHGSGSTASAVSQQAEVLVANGYGVLMTDARGHGRSEGTAMDFGWYGETDIAAAVDFLADQPEVDTSRIVIVGISMGGEEAIGAAGSDDRIAAVVAEGATARTDADKTWLIDEYGWRGSIQLRLEWLQYGVADLLSDGSKPPSLATAAGRADPTPILMITGGAAPDEVKAATHIQEASPANVSVWTVPQARHVGGLSTAPDKWERTVIDFLDEALKDG